MPVGNSGKRAQKWMLFPEFLNLSFVLPESCSNSHVNSMVIICYFAFASCCDELYTYLALYGKHNSAYSRFPLAGISPAPVLPKHCRSKFRWCIDLDSVSADTWIKIQVPLMSGFGFRCCRFPDSDSGSADTRIQIQVPPIPGFGPCLQLVPVSHKTVFQVPVKYYPICVKIYPIMSTFRRFVLWKR